VEGQLLGTIEVPSTGGWDVWQEFELAVDAPAGKHELFLAFPTGGMDLDQIRFGP
jgi:hypothetical protein